MGYLESRFFRKWGIDSAAAWQPRCMPSLCLHFGDLGALGIWPHVESADAQVSVTCEGFMGFASAVAKLH